jgi:hypothetical protein
MQYEVECTTTVWVEVKAKNSKEAHKLATKTVIDIMKEVTNREAIVLVSSEKCKKAKKII